MVIRSALRNKQIQLAGQRSFAERAGCICFDVSVICAQRCIVAIVAGRIASGTNTQIGPKDFFEMGSNQIYRAILYIRSCLGTAPGICSLSFPASKIRNEGTLKIL